jgi:hypothetical protein
LLANGKTFETRAHPVKSNICCNIWEVRCRFYKKRYQLQKSLYFQKPLDQARGEW